MATLYRYYDDYGQLLYVGQTGKGHRRTSGHSKRAAWWGLVHFAEFHEVDPQEIDLAERLAIWVERPLYNRVGRCTTEQRQAMLARLAAVEADRPGREYNLDTVRGVLQLTEDEVDSAARWGFLECSYARKRVFTASQLRQFIGEHDEGTYPRYPLPYAPPGLTRRLRPELVRDLQ